MTTLHYAAMDRSLAEILTAAPPEAERVVLCGPYPSAMALRGWLRAEGWEIAVRKVRKGGIVHATASHHDGRRVRLASMGEWLPGATVEPHRARALLAYVAEKCRDQFHTPGAYPLVTPRALGLHLWRASGGAAAPVLPADMQQHLRHYSTPNRREVLAAPGTIAHAEVWDLRFAYGALCEHLPVGPAHWQTGGELTPSLVGLVRVVYRVPEDWRHVGLLLEQAPGGGWVWPAEPGYQGESWCDASEARLARRLGWEVTLLEALVMQEGRPCDTWARRLVRLYSAEPDEQARRMFRRVLICTVGGFRGYGLSRETVIETGDDLGPAVFDEPSEPVRAEMALAEHPEWCAAVWSRVRYRMVKAMLALPRENLLGVYGDNLWTTGEVPDTDRGMIGDLRRKGGRVPGPLPAPWCEAELHALTKRAEALHA